MSQQSCTAQGAAGLTSSPGHRPLQLLCWGEKRQNEPLSHSALPFFDESSPREGYQGRRSAKTDEQWWHLKPRVPCLRRAFLRCAARALLSESRGRCSCGQKEH